MKIIDLVSRDGRLSHTKIWANIGYAAATVSFVRLNWVGQAETEVWWAYLSCVAATVSFQIF